MGTSTANLQNSPSVPSNPNNRVQRQIYNDKFQTITVVKPFNAKIADGITSIDEAVKLLDGPEELLDIIKAGIVSKERAKVASESGGWFVLNTKTTELEGAYDGVQLNRKRANDTRLMLAKVMYPAVYATDPEKAKAQATEFLTSSSGAPILEGLKAKPGDAEVETETEA